MWTSSPSRRISGDIESIVLWFLAIFVGYQLVGCKLVDIPLPSSKTVSKLDYWLNHVLDATIRDIPEIPPPPSSPAANYEPNFIEMYDKGVDAYLENDWEACINHIERAVHLHRNYIEATANCRIQCEIERERFKNSRPNNFDHIHFYEKLIVKTLCLEKCRQRNLDQLPRYFTIEREYREIFRQRKPYEYLQLCYYRNDELEKAISATYTVLVANPDEAMTKKNFEYYMQQREFDWNNLRDLEEKRFAAYYLNGIEKYEKKEWLQAIELLEIALDLWLQEHDKCRALCENDFEQGWLPDFTTAFANHYVFTMRCKQNCTKELSFASGQFYEDLFPSIYNYLQFAYYKTDQLEQANRCAASFLLFYPNDEDMLQNAEFYGAQISKKSREFSKPRKEADKFYKRTLYEIAILDWVDKEFAKLIKEPFRPAPTTDHLSDHKIDYFAGKAKVTIVSENNVE